MRNFFAIILISVCILGHASAHAGFLTRCWHYLVNDPPAETPLTKGYNDYERFLRVRRANPSLIPPAKPVTKETTKEEKFFGFEYWWLPANVWHMAMTTQYSGMHMVREFKRAGGKVPTRASMPKVEPNDSSLNVPQELPELPPGRLSYGFKRTQRRELETYQRAREKDRYILPPVTVATEDTSAEDVYFGFRFWWFPQNIWHSTIGPQHGEFAKRILEAHIRDGFVFPEPPRIVLEEEFEVPAHRERDIARELSRNPMTISPLLGISPEAAALDHAATEIDAGDTGGPNTADVGPGAGPNASPGGTQQ